MTDRKDPKPSDRSSAPNSLKPHTKPPEVLISIKPIQTMGNTRPALVVETHSKHAFVSVTQTTPATQAIPTKGSIQSAVATKTSEAKIQVKTPEPVNQVETKEPAAQSKPVTKPTVVESKDGQKMTSESEEAFRARHADYVRTQNYRSLAFHPPPTGTASNFKVEQPVQFSFRGFGMISNGQSMVPSKTAEELQLQMKLEEEAYKVQDAMNAKFNKASIDSAKAIAEAKNAGTMPPTPHWIDPNFSFQTLTSDLLSTIATTLTEQRIDHDFTRDKFKIRGVVYEDNYNVEFTIRQYKSLHPSGRVFTIEVQRKKSPVVPFSVFYKWIKDRHADHVFIPSGMEKKATGYPVRQLKTMELFDDLADFKPDPVSFSTLEPFMVMLRSVHADVRKEGFRALVSLAASSIDDNSKRMVECHDYTHDEKKESRDAESEKKESNDAKTEQKQTINWINALKQLDPLVDTKSTPDIETIRLIAHLAHGLCQANIDKFNDAVVKHLLPCFIHHLGAQPTLLYREIHRQIAKTLAILAKTHDIPSLVGYPGREILKRHQYCQDYDLRVAIGKICNKGILVPSLS